MTFEESLAVSHMERHNVSRWCFYPPRYLLLSLDAFDQRYATVNGTHFSFIWTTLSVIHFYNL